MTFERSFTFDISITETLTVSEIWPDGDAPENPTVDDVRAVFLGKDARRGSSIERQLSDWSLMPCAEDVTITDDTAFLERMAKLKNKSLPAESDGVTEANDGGEGKQGL